MQFPPIYIIHDVKIEEITLVISLLTKHILGRSSFIKDDYFDTVTQDTFERLSDYVNKFETTPKPMPKDEVEKRRDISDEIYRS